MWWSEIAGHVDAPKGFLKEVVSGKSKKQIHANEAIMALEIIDISRRNDWLQGKIYPAKRAVYKGQMPIVFPLLVHVQYGYELQI